jgi:hypothetical protein
VKGWPSPRASEADKQPKDDNRNSPCLSHVVTSAWPTPRASENENRTTRNAPTHGKTHGKTLAGEAMSLASAWPTPTVRDHKDGSAESCKNVPVNGLLGRMVHCTDPDSSQGPDSLSTNGSRPESLKLSADWVEALMDVPVMWTDCDYLATESIQPQPQRHLSLFSES